MPFGHFPSIEGPIVFEIIDKNLVIEGYIFYKHKESKNGLMTYWECNRLRLKMCKARAITQMVNNEVRLKKHGAHEICKYYNMKIYMNYFSKFFYFYLFG